MQDGETISGSANDNDSSREIEEGQRHRRTNFTVLYDTMQAQSIDNSTYSPLLRYVVLHIRRGQPYSYDIGHDDRNVSIDDAYRENCMCAMTITAGMPSVHVKATLLYIVVCSAQHEVIGTAIGLQQVPLASFPHDYWTGHRDVSLSKAQYIR